MRQISILLSIAGLLAVPAAATAAQGNIPPGNSGGNQYTEGIPGPGGNQRTHGGGGGQNGQGSSPLSPSARQALAGRGALGERVAALAAATGTGHRVGGGQTAGAAGKGAAGKGAGGKGQSKGGNGAASGGNGDSGLLSAVKHAVGDEDSGGMGIVLPLIIGLSLLGALAIVLARRRGGGGEQAH